MASPLKILVVDDHKDSATAISRLLKRAGHTVEVALSYNEALARCSEVVFDLLVADVGLPDGDGRQLISELRSRGGPRGIAVTGLGPEVDVESCHKAGFEVVIVKPFQIAALSAAVNDVDSMPKR